MIWNPEQIRDGFLKGARTAGIDIQRDDIDIEILERPHRPPQLPEGKVAVFVFSTETSVLKVSKVGPNSGPRYTSQHYNPNAAISNLAKSLLKDASMKQRYNLREVTVGDWIKRNTDRVNFILDEPFYGRTLDRLKDFLLDRLQPVYEGRQERKGDGATL